MALVSQNDTGSEADSFVGSYHLRERSSLKNRMFTIWQEYW